MELTAKRNLIQLIFLLIACQQQITNGENLVPCSIYEKNCTITGLTLSLTNFTFKPVASNANNVLGLEIRKSTVPVITTEICSALPKIRSFVAVQQGIQVIQDYAFNNCTEITLISLPFNSIHTLGKGIFDNTKKLQEINMHGGSLEQIDVNLLDNLGELLEFVISANRLKVLPVAAVKNLKKLKILYLYSNDLTDLDAEGLISNLPSLRAVYINDNNFPCDRLSEIMATFKAKNILVVDHTHAIYLRKRDYIPHKINDIICLSHVEIESEKLKNGLNLTLAELKNTPIGSAVIHLKDIVSSGFQDADANIVTLFNILNETSNDFNSQLVNVNRTLNETNRNLKDMADTIAHLPNDGQSVPVNDNRSLIETNRKLQEMADTIARTVNDTNRKLQEMADTLATIAHLTTDQKSEPASSTSTSETSTAVIWVVVVCSLLVIGVVGFFIYLKLRRNPFGVMLSYHRNDVIPLTDE